MPINPKEITWDSPSPSGITWDDEDSKKKPESSWSGLGTAIARNWAEAGNAADSLYTLAARGPFTDTKDLPAMIDALNERKKQRLQIVDPDNTQSGWAAQRMANLVTMPMTMMTSAAAGPVEKEVQWHDNGESFGKTMAAGLITSGMNAVGLLAPPFIGKTAGTQIASGAALNTLQTAAQKAVLGQVADKAKTKKQEEITGTDLVDAALGGMVMPGLEAARKNLPKPFGLGGSTDTNAVSKQTQVLKDKLAQLEEPKVPQQVDNQTYVNDLPEAVRNAQEGLNRQAQYESVNPQEKAPVDVDHTNQLELPLENEAVSSVVKQDQVAQPEQGQLFPYQEDLSGRKPTLPPSEEVQAQMAQEAFNKPQDIEAAYDQQQQIKQAQMDDMWANKQADLDYQTNQENNLNKDDFYSKLEQDLSKFPSPNYGIGPKTRAFLRAKKQGGSVDFKSIADSMSEITDKIQGMIGGLSRFTPKEITGNKQIDFLKKIPGFENPGPDLIPKPIDADKALPLLQQAKDTSSPIWNNVQAGAQLTGEKFQSPLMKYAANWAEWADKRAELAKEKQVNPIRNDVVKMSQPDRNALAEILKHENSTQRRLSPQELDSLGLSTRQRMAYDNFRKAADDLYTQQAEQLLAQGKTPPTPEEAYLTSTRNGDYHITLNTKHDVGTPKERLGETIYHSQFTNRFQAQKAIDWLKKNVPEEVLKNSNINDLTWEYIPNNIVSRLPKDSLGAYMAVAKAIDPNHPATRAIEQAIQDAQVKLGYTNRGINERFMKKSYVPGFEGDMPWLSEKENANRLFEAQLKTLEDGHRWLATQEMANNMSKVLSDPTIIKNQPNNIGYLRPYVENVLGLSGSTTREFENLVGKMFGFSGVSLRNLGHNTKALTTLTQLGHSVGYMIATPITALNSIGKATKEAGLGAFNPNTFAKTMIDLPSMVVGDIAHEMSGKDLNGPMTELGKDIQQYIYNNGVTTKNIVSSSMSVGSSAPRRAIEGLTKGTIAAPEKLQRLVTFTYMAHLLNDIGGFANKQDLLHRADELTQMASTNFRPSERPMIVNKLGIMGNMGYIYKAPLFNYLHQMSEYGRDFYNGAKSGNPSKMLPFIVMLGMTTALTGLKNAPLVNELDSGWNVLKEGISKFLPQHYHLVQGLGLKQLIAKQAGNASANEWLNNALENGVPSAVTGTQLGTRFAPNIMDMENPVSIFAPVAQEVMEWGGIGNAVVNPTRQNIETAIYKNATPLIRGLMETNLDDYRGPTRPDGRTPFYQPSMLGEHNKVQTLRTPDQIKKRSLGLRDLTEANHLETRYAVGKEQDRQDQAFSKLLNKAVRAAQNGDGRGAQEYGTKALQLLPDQDLAQRYINYLAKQSRMSPEELKAASADGGDASAVQYLRKMREQERKGQ